MDGATATTASTGPGPLAESALVAARRYVGAGNSVVPVPPDGSKFPAGMNWKPYQRRRPRATEVESWFGPRRRAGGATNGPAVVTGAVSGGREAIDFDTAALFAPWAERVEQRAPGLVARLTLVQTPRPGYHVHYRCPGAVEGNQALAREPRTPTPDEPAAFRTLIETRGEGGLILTPGCPAACHPDKKPYVLLRGDVAAPVTVTPQERAILLDTAREFNTFAGAVVQAPHATHAPHPGARHPELPAPDAGMSLRPGDDYDARARWDELLPAHGWKRLYARRDQAMWQRPGKQGLGGSATTNFAGSNLLYVFSSNAAPFAPDTSYTPFAAYALLVHDGDFAAAARALRQQGFGSPSEAQAPSGEPGKAALDDPFTRFSRPLVAAAADPPGTEDPGPGDEGDLREERDQGFGSFSRFSRKGGTRERLAAAFSEVPDLPAAASLPDEALAAAGVIRAVWLDPYVDAAAARYPMSPRSLHEAAGLAALITADARRHYVLAAHKRHFASLNLLFVAESGVSKTDALSFLRDVTRAAGLRDLLLPSTFTAPALVDFLSLHLPEKVRQEGGRRLEAWQTEHRHGAVGTVVRDELAGILDDCSADYNAGLLPLLLKLAGAPEWVDDEMTLSRGRVAIERACVTIVGATTPIALKTHAGKAEHWHNGLFSRFNLIAPHEPIREVFWQRGRAELTHLPQRVVDGLHEVYVCRPAPTLELEVEAVPANDEADGNGDDEGASAGMEPSASKGGTGKSERRRRITGVRQVGYAPREVPVTDAAWARWERYFYALRLLRQQLPDRLKSTYTRLHDHAIRIALSLAVAEWAIDGRHRGQEGPVVDTGHWAAAQGLTEAWRRDAHLILAEAILGEQAEAQQAAGLQLLAYLERARTQDDKGRISRGQVLRDLHWSASALDEAIAGTRGRAVECSEKTGGRDARFVALVSQGLAAGPVDSTHGAPPATKATKASNDTVADDGQMSGAVHEPAVAPESAASKGRVKRLKTPVEASGRDAHEPVAAVEVFRP